jgi:hypothetical protein
MTTLGGNLGQTQVNVQPAPAVAGDFASKNPYWTYDAGPGGLVAGPNGLSVGLFAWVTAPHDADGTPSYANNAGTGNVAGFVHRGQQGLIENYLATSSMLIPAGFPVVLMNGGDFWVVNGGSGVAQVGMKAYAAFATGAASFAASGAPSSGGTSTASTIAATTFSATGSIAGDVMTVTAVGSGTVYPGSTISGTNVTSGNQVVSQISGAAGGVGTYYVSIPEQSVASTTISGTYGLLTVGGTVAGNFAVNDVLAATGSVVAGTTITAAISGTGGAGTYVVNNNTAVSSQAINVAAVNVETKWYAASNGLPGELVKITSHVNNYG